MKKKLYILVALLVISFVFSADSSSIWQPVTYGYLTENYGRNKNNLHWNLELSGCQGALHVNMSEYSHNSSHYRLNGATIYFTECEFP